MNYPKIKTLKNNPHLNGLARLVPDVIFSKATGVDLKMQILVPWDITIGENETEVPLKPLIVFLQGSAWTFPDVNYEIPQLSEYARMGYVVATITHRSFLDGYPAPAFLQDTKTAIRFLRKNAKTYGIDTDRVCFWGTSSGGNTSMLVAMTGDDPRYKTEEYPDFSDSVSVAVECFGPSDLLVLLDKKSDKPDSEMRFNGFVGGELEDHIDLLKEMSPYHIIDKSQKYPPLLLLHGDADPVVSYEQGEMMYKALIDNGNEAEMIRIENGPHEDSFWSRELHYEILDFLRRRL